MFTNYLKIAVRNLRKNKIYSAITIIGLAIGMACAVLILSYIRFELSYDQYHEKKDRLYRLATNVGDGSDGGIAKINGPWGLAAKAEIPEIEAVTRFVFTSQTLMARNDQRFYETGGLYADSSVFTMFGYRLLRGSTVTSLVEPHSIVLTQSLAQKYFGDENPVGQTLTLDGGSLFTVTGVLADVPLNSHFRFSFLLSMASLTHPDRDDWIRWNQFYTYLLLREGAAPGAVEQKMPAILREHMGEQGARFSPFLQPITDIHLHSNLFREMEANSNVGYLIVLGAVGLFLLLLGCVNFMNLSTARAAIRAKEIGVRKAAGADRITLSWQFLTESIFLCLLSLMLALALVDTLFPLFNSITGSALSIGLITDVWFILGLVVLTIGVGVFAGSYPAFVLSSFRPVAVLRGQWNSSAGVWMRKGLVVFQFAISGFFLVATGVVYQQLRYIQEKQFGFNDEQLLTIRIQDPSLKPQYESIKQRLLQYSGILSVSASANMPGGSDYGIPYQPEGLTREQTPGARILVVDEDFISTFEMTMATGESFSKQTFATNREAFIINEEAARQLGWENPIGKRIAMEGIGRGLSPVIGVIKDFHFHSLHEPISPLLIMLPPAPNWLSYFTVRVRPEGLNETLAYIERTFTEFDPAHPFTFTFFDEQFARLHRGEERLSEMVQLFALLAIAIACLGLFGLATFSAERRTKEIGVRKVLGASVTRVVALLSTDFLKLVLLANIVAWPLAYYAMNLWLESFAYRVTIAWWIFPLACSAAVFIALLTVSFQAVKAALTNPVDALRYE